jgi:hypothetical protein
MDYDSRLQELAQRAFTAKFSLWTALLTAHTVLLSVAIALLVTVKPSEAWPFKVVGFVAILCMIVLLLNVGVTKSQYETIGQRLVNPEVEISESERNRDLSKSFVRRYFAAIGETMAILGLGVEVSLLAWVLATT